MAERTLEEQRAYDEGVLAQRLNGYDIHFAVINGSIADTARELKTINAQFDKLRTTLIVRDETLKATVKASHEAQEMGFTKWQLRLTAFGLVLAAFAPYVIAHFTG